MKMKRLFYATLFLAAALPLSAAELFTNEVKHSCCQPMVASLKALPEKSIYQLESVWTNDQNQAIQLSALKGRPQIVVMFFASCQYTCPLTVFQLKQLEQALPHTLRTNVGFTLVSFDSQRDTPAALTDYRAQHELPRVNWTLLNGDADGVSDLAAVLGVKFKQDAPGQFSHSNVITLLNSQGEIAYQQIGLNPGNPELIRWIEKLERH
jgi:protein SCO1/2